MRKLSSIAGAILAICLLAVPLAPAWGQKTGKAKTRNAAVARHMRARSSDDAAIRALVQQMIVAFNAKDIDKIMSFYVTGDDLVAFDVVPPRQYVGSDAYRKDWEEFLAMYSGMPTMEITDLTVGSSGDLGYSHQIVHLTGALKKGGNMDLTLRVTDVYRKRNGKWQAIHEHVSVPVDIDTRKADLQSKP